MEIDYTGRSVIRRTNGALSGDTRPKKARTQQCQREHFPRLAQIAQGVEIGQRRQEHAHESPCIVGFKRQNNEIAPANQQGGDAKHGQHGGDRIHKTVSERRESNEAQYKC